MQTPSGVRRVTNQKVNIATRGTDHIATTVEPDCCYVPGGAPCPFDNWVESKKLQLGQTTQTFIQGQPIWTRFGELGPPSEPAHAGTNKGVASHTYRDVARPTSWSPDVYAEDNPVVRTGDSTEHNDANTVGTVVEGQGDNELPAECAYLNQPEVLTGDGDRWNQLREKDHAVGDQTRDSQHKFAGGSGPEAAKSVTATVGGHDVTIISAANVSLPDTFHLPTPEDLAEGLAVLPQPVLDSIDTIILNPYRNPADADWEVTPGYARYDEKTGELKRDWFYSAATAGSGVVTIYPTWAYNQQGEVDRVLQHEGGHTLRDELVNDGKFEKRWNDAIASDRHGAPSKYAESAWSEDLSESMVMYRLSKGTPCEEHARRLYGKRYEILDEIMAEKQ